MAVVCYVSLLLIYFICSNLYLLIPHSNCPSPLPLLFGNHKFVFYICKYVSVLSIYSFVSWTLLNRSGENRHPCFLPDLKKKAFRFSPLIMVLTLLGWRSSLLFLVCVFLSRKSVEIFRFFSVTDIFIPLNWEGAFLFQLDPYDSFHILL